MTWKEAVVLPFKFILSFLDWIFSVLSSLMPKRIRRLLHFFRRYACKWTYHQKSSAGTTLHRLSPYPRRRAPAENTTDRALASILLIDIIPLIASELHYSDFVRLGLTSKRIKHALFPNNEKPDYNWELLRLYSCGVGMKTDCWACGIQICEVRSGTRNQKCN